MLTELRVRNLALISAVELEFGPGLTVLSGETGAGKTALLSSLKLLVGERGDSTMVGSEAHEARVEALFTVAVEKEAEPALEEETRHALGEEAPFDLKEAELASEEESPLVLAGQASRDSEEREYLVARRLSADGRSRCYLDDSLVTVGKLGSTLGPSVDLYGQHEHLSLLKASEQLAVLDEYAGEEVAWALRVYQESLFAYKRAKETLQNLRELSTSSNSEREQAAYVLREIAKVAPQPGEYEALESELPRLQNAVQLAEAANTALALVRGEDGALEKLAAAQRSLEGIQGVDAALGEPLGQLVGLSIELEEITADIARYAAGIEFDPERLQVALDRLGELDGLCRRFGPGMDQVFMLVERSEQAVQSTEDVEGHIKMAEAELAQAAEECKTAAAELAVLRKSAAENMQLELNGSLAVLALPDASLEFAISDLPFEKWSPTGSQSLELLYRPAPSATARPLAKIASGGELSRVMLAVKGLLQSSNSSMTLVFDEIDAGIGGGAANAVAERLASLAKQHQVIVITHLAQIAALADHHFLVSKVNENGTIQTAITCLDGAERAQEIARMLSGSSDKEALAHAEKLLGKTY